MRRASHARASLGLRRAAPPASHPTVFGIMYVASNAAYMSSGFLIDGVLAAARRPGSGVTSGSRALMLICAAAASAAASLAGALREEQVRAVARDADAGAAGEGAAAPEQPLTAARLRAAAADPAARRALGVAAVATTAVRLAKTVWDHQARRRPTPPRVLHHQHSRQIPTHKTKPAPHSPPPPPQALTFPKYAIRSRGCGAPFGALDSINGAAVVLLVPAATHLLAHLPPGRLVRAGTPGFALSPLLLAVPSYVAFALYFLASSAFEAVWSPQADSWLLSLLPPGREGIFTGLAQIPSSLVGLLSGALSGGLLARFCPLAAEASCAAAAPGAAAAARGRDAPCRGAPVWAAVAAVACAGPAALWLLRGWLVAPQPPAPRGAGEGAAGVPPAAEEGGEDEASGLLAGGGGGGGGSSTVG